MKKQLFSLFLLLTVTSCVVEKAQPASLPEDEFLIIAHRGASAYVPEHTIPAYEMAKQMGAHYIELDLQMTSDGQLVSIHDSELSTTTDGKGSVADITLGELKTMSAGSKFNEENPELAEVFHEKLTVPELGEIFGNFGESVNYYIELKSPSSYDSMEEKLIAILTEQDLIGINNGLPKIIIQSFDKQSLKKVHGMAPTIPLIQLYAFKSEATLNKHEIIDLQTYASGIGVNFDSLTPAFIREMHAAGLHVHVFTVNEPEPIRSLIDIGVNGVFTDRPDVAVEIVGERK